MKFPTSIIIILLFLSPVILTDYSGHNVSGINVVDQKAVSESSGEDWLSGWSYRKFHIILGSAGAGTNYQVRIIVHFGSGIDDGSEVYCDGYVNP
ncbi:MAG: hypothetical protein ACXAEN_26420, partial [Candidatus Thorarchaeota archaeon]